MFDLVKRVDVENQMRFFYEGLTPFTFTMFRFNMVVNRVLHEPMTRFCEDDMEDDMEEDMGCLSEHELQKYFNYVIRFARKSVGAAENENMLELVLLEEKKGLLEVQLQELEEMKKKVKKGEAVQVLSKKERKLMKPKPIDREEEKKRMKKEYKAMMRKAEEEEKNNVPLEQRHYVKRTKEEWKREWKRMLAMRVKAEDEEREKIQHLFEKQPTLSEVKNRIHSFESRLESVQMKIETAKAKSVQSMKNIVKRNVDPRITISWCKRVRNGWWSNA